MSLQQRHRTPQPIQDGALLSSCIGVAILLCTAALAVASCAAPAPAATTSPPLFGSPTAQTGLSAAQCNARCQGSSFVPRSFSPADLAVLRSTQLDEPIADITVDPYQRPVTARPGVCAVVVTDVAARRYLLRTYPSAQDAAAQGAIVTHHDGCGACSALADLAVYAADPDLGAPVRACAQSTLLSSHAERVACLRQLGFTQPCASIWSFNIEATRDKCLTTCITTAGAPYHRPDGALNDCLACDERESGPVFKAVAGRNRRNTGIPTAMCRPCDEVRPVAHDYPWLSRTGQPAR